AEEMADRVGVINKGKLLLVDGTAGIMAQLGRTEARFALESPLREVPGSVAAFPVALDDDGATLVYRGGDGTGTGKREVADLTRVLVREGIGFSAIETAESSLEEIFVGLVEERKEPAA